MRIFSVSVLVVVLLSNVGHATCYRLIPADYETEIPSLADHPKRLLRKYDADEERVIGAGTISGLVNKIASKLTEKLVKFNKYDDQLAAKLKLDVHSVDDILKSSKKLEKVTVAVKQANSNNRIKKASVIGTLTAGYGDDALTKALVTAEQQAKQQGLPGSVQQLRSLRNDQLTRWKNAGNSADDVFKLLNVGDDSRMLLVLDDYVKLVSPKNSDTSSILFNTLMTGFRKRDDKIGALLYAAKKNPDTMEKALQLETSLVSKWAHEGQLPGNVFQWLKLHDDVNYAFSADNFKTFAKYVDDFKPTDKTSALELYTNSFKGDDVAKYLVSLSAMDDRSIRNAAKNLQKEQLLGWKNSGKSVDDVFEIFKISLKESPAIISSKLDALEEFIKLTGGEKNLIKTLTAKFGGNRNLAGILQTASTTTQTTSLQKKQFALWVTNKVTPENFVSSLYKNGVNTPMEKTIENKFTQFYLKSG
ncbi:RxLR effector protein [Phytophthora megakarya]|uniref:RxLR effector protein n=1 Tax=Phytophthora megakarya TaxID=4795 RepID=A0A225WKP6_9STRA|nr:RxLR effector protein [Phytophthora megakarya]